jgi:hypothetical protein
VLWSLDQQGQGPGEVRRPWLVDAVGDEIALFDIGRRRVLLLTLEGKLRREIIIPYFLYGMTAAPGGLIHAAGVVDAGLEPTAQRVVHTFDGGGALVASHALEKPFFARDVSNYDARQIVHHYYSGRSAVERRGDDLLVSPVFDHATYLYDVHGRLLQRYRNPAFDPTLLGYEASDAGATFKNVETISGPAVSWLAGRVAKGYQIADGDRLRYTLDVFDGDGEVVAGQIPVDGLLHAVDAEGRLYTVRNFPYPRITVYRLELLDGGRDGRDRTGES